MEINNNSVSSPLRVDGKCNVIPARPSERRYIKLSPLDLQMLSVDYNQKGFVYQIPAHNLSSVVDQLATSLSRLLVDFYPLAGRLTNLPSDGAIYIDCNDAGVEFVEATADDVSVADLTPDDYDHPVIRDLFALNGARNVDAHRLPLVGVQVTKLRDGLFLACTVSHAAADGASFFHFFNSWAEICRGPEKDSVDPIHDRDLLSPSSTVRLNLEGIIPKFYPPLPPLRVKMFHFSEETVKALKERANRGSRVPISSLQALCGHLWQAVTRARRLEPVEPTTFTFLVNCRSRLIPPLPSSYFGNALQSVRTTVTAGELTGNDATFEARLLHGIVEAHNEDAIREKIRGWETAPASFPLNLFEKNRVLVAGSPRFRIYENDFGWGEPLVIGGGFANVFDGKVAACESKEGGASVDLEIRLLPSTMAALEADHEFLYSRPS